MDVQSTGFYGDLANSEASDDSTINPWGYAGRLQFGPERLHDIFGRDVSPEEFAGSSEMQRFAESEHFKLMDQEFERLGINPHIGNATINGLPLTRSAAYGIAHLGGSGGLQDYINSGGEDNPADQLGTHLSDYHEKFMNSSLKPTDDAMVSADTGAYGPYANSAKDAATTFEKDFYQMRQEAAEAEKNAWQMAATPFDIRRWQNNEIFAPKKEPAQRPTPYGGPTIANAQRAQDYDALMAALYPQQGPGHDSNKRLTDPTDHPADPGLIPNQRPNPSTAYVPFEGEGRFDSSRPASVFNQPTADDVPTLNEPVTSSANTGQPAPPVHSVNNQPENIDADPVSEEEEKDPWNWKLSLFEGLESFGVGIGQMSTGQSVNLTAPRARQDARRAQVATEEQNKINSALENQKQQIEYLKEQRLGSEEANKVMQGQQQRLAAAQLAASRGASGDDIDAILNDASNTMATQYAQSAFSAENQKSQPFAAQKDRDGLASAMEASGQYNDRTIEAVRESPALAAELAKSLEKALLPSGGESEATVPASAAYIDQTRSLLADPDMELTPSERKQAALQLNRAEGFLEANDQKSANLVMQSVEATMQAAAERQGAIAQTAEETDITAQAESKARLEQHGLNLEEIEHRAGFDAELVEQKAEDAIALQEDAQGHDMTVAEKQAEYQKAAEEHKRDLDRQEKQRTKVERQETAEQIYPDDENLQSVYVNQSPEAAQTAFNSKKYSEMMEQSDYYSDSDYDGAIQLARTDPELAGKMISHIDSVKAAEAAKAEEAAQTEALTAFVREDLGDPELAGLIEQGQTVTAMKILEEKYKDNTPAEQRLISWLANGATDEEREIYMQGKRESAGKLNSTQQLSVDTWTAELGDADEILDRADMLTPQLLAAQQLAQAAGFKSGILHNALMPVANTLQGLGVATGYQLAEAETFQGMFSGMIQYYRQEGSGPMSDFDAIKIEQSLGSLKDSPMGNKAKIQYLLWVQQNAAVQARATREYALSHDITDPDSFDSMKAFQQQKIEEAGLNELPFPSYQNVPEADLDSRIADDIASGKVNAGSIIMVGDGSLQEVTPELYTALGGQ